MKKNELPIYLYEGKEVLLCYVDEVNGIEPIYEEMGKGVYLVTDELLAYMEEHDMLSCLTSDDCYSDYTEPEEIICTEIINPENQQCIVVDWVRVSYAADTNMTQDILTMVESIGAIQVD